MEQQCNAGFRNRSVRALQSVVVVGPLSSEDAQKTHSLLLWGRIYDGEGRIEERECWVICRLSL